MGDSQLVDRSRLPVAATVRAHGRPRVTVVVPYGGTCPHRHAALRWVVARYRTRHPDWQVLVGRVDGPWCKARAVTDALTRARGDVVAVVDADCWTDHLTEAVALIDGGAPWVVPHRRVYRLTPEATSEVLAGTEPHVGLACERIPYVGHDGGGAVVMPVDLYRRVPLDPRFVGWGQEDDSWGVALHTLAPGHRQIDRPLWHLWHPPAARARQGVGNGTGLALFARYCEANGHPEAMAALLAETA